MECPKCKSQNLDKLHWNTVLPQEQGGMVRGASHPATASISTLWYLGSGLAKMTLSTPYRCKSCGNQWRAW